MMSSDWRQIEAAPTDGTPIMAMIVDPDTDIMMVRTAVWFKDRVTKYNPEGGFWVCPNLRCVIGPFTHWRPLT